MVHPGLANDAWMSVDAARRYRALSEYQGAKRSAQLSDLEEGRVRATIAMVPADVRSIVDVGCGDGRITRRVSSRFQPVAVDLSHIAIAGSHGKRVCASSGALPFGDGSFDLGLCCEVLEHLPAGVFKSTIEELERVSARYILVSVPYKERLLTNMMKCVRCRSLFHIWGHVRGFSLGDLNRLFQGYQVISRRFYGKRDPYRSSLIVRLNQRFGNRWAGPDKGTMCPHCGNTEFGGIKRNPVTVACGIMNLLTTKLVPVLHRNWVIVLYARRSTRD